MASPLSNGLPRQSYEYVEGWGMTHGAHARIWRPETVEQVRSVFRAARAEGRSIALRGSGCSYGDASVTSDGHVLDITRMNRILGFDAETGIAEVEAGVTISDLWRHSLPQGYWPMVVSGTMAPTMAGAAGMNIHGKNNFKVGTFGEHVQEFDMVLPDGDLITASPTENADIYHAAIGGFGMLGCMTRLKVATKQVHSGEIKTKGISVHHLREMMEYFEAHKHEADYLVGWLDCFAGEDGLGRGLIHH
ncbi:MAG: decaprenylphospho-beta-D-ribofuranose 2-oxidase, partial [Planctomycetota bacterium]